MWLLALSLLALGSVCPRVRADITAATVARCKHATALVLVGEKDLGTAFHIGRGLYVTSSHLLDEGGGPVKVRLVLDTGETSQRVIAASRLRADPDLDLALLSTDERPPPAAIELGDDGGLMETTRVTAFGYPFGKDLALGKGDYHAITVSTGRITSLRKTDGKLSRIQIDASLNPGNSGGPLVSDAGKVLGIVRSGIMGTGVNFAVPVGHLHRFLSEPVLALRAPSLKSCEPGKPAPFNIEVVTVNDSADGMSVSITLSTHDQDTRRYTAVAAGGGRFTVVAPLLSVAGAGPPAAAVLYEIAVARDRAVVARQTGVITAEGVEPDMVAGPPMEVTGSGGSLAPRAITAAGARYRTSGPHETISSAFTRPDGGVTRFSYSGHVLVNVKGVGQAYTPTYNDAFYLFGGPFQRPHNGHDGGYYQLAFGTSPLKEFSLASNATNYLVGPVPPYNSRHEYELVLNTRLTVAGRLHFGVSDGGFNDNTGAYTVTVTQLALTP